MKDNRINLTLHCLYDLYKQHKLLFEFYMNHKDLKGEEEIRERIKYILKNKVKQKDEVSTLMWVLGENNENQRRD